MFLKRINKYNRESTRSYKFFPTTVNTLPKMTEFLFCTKIRQINPFFYVYDKKYYTSYTIRLTGKKDIYQGISSKIKNKIYLWFTELPIIKFPTIWPFILPGLVKPHVVKSNAIYWQVLYMTTNVGTEMRVSGKFLLRTFSKSKRPYVLTLLF